MPAKPIELTQTVINHWRLFVKHVGHLWTGTKLTGYAEDGPYHCDDCRYLKGKVEGETFRDAVGQGRCIHKLVRLDEEVKHDNNGDGIVNIAKGCCEFVDNDLREIKQQ